MGPRPELMRHSDLKLATNLDTNKAQLPPAARVAARPGFATTQSDSYGEATSGRKSPKLSVLQPLSGTNC